MQAASFMQYVTQCAGIALKKVNRFYTIQPVYRWRRIRDTKTSNIFPQFTKDEFVRLAFGQARYLEMRRMIEAAPFKASREKRRDR